MSRFSSSGEKRLCGKRVGLGRTGGHRRGRDRTKGPMIRRTYLPEIYESPCFARRNRGSRQPCIAIRRCGQRDTFGTFEYLEKLKRKAPFLIECGNFAIEDCRGRLPTISRLQGVDGNRTSFYCVDQTHIFSVFESQCPVPIVFDFVEPVAFRQLLNRSRLHRFNERETSSSVLFHSPSPFRLFLMRGQSFKSPNWKKKAANCRTDLR